MKFTKELFEEYLKIEEQLEEEYFFWKLGKDVLSEVPDYKESLELRIMFLKAHNKYMTRKTNIMRVQKVLANIQIYFLRLIVNVLGIKDEEIETKRLEKLYRTFK